MTPVLGGGTTGADGVVGVGATGVGVPTGTSEVVCCVVMTCLVKHWRVEASTLSHA